MEMLPVDLNLSILSNVGHWKHL